MSEKEVCIILTAGEAEVLSQLASSELRSEESQLRYLIRAEAKRHGLGRTMSLLDSLSEAVRDVEAELCHLSDQADDRASEIEEYGEIIEMAEWVSTSLDEIRAVPSEVHRNLKSIMGNISLATTFTPTDRVIGWISVSETPSAIGGSPLIYRHESGRISTGTFANGVFCALDGSIIAGDSIVEWITARGMMNSFKGWFEAMDVMHRQIEKNEPHEVALMKIAQSAQEIHSKISCVLTDND